MSARRGRLAPEARPRRAEESNGIGPTTVENYGFRPYTLMDVKIPVSKLMKAPRPLLSAAAGVVISLLLVACSGAGFVYSNADWFLKYWADDYLQLDGPQLARWDPLLETALKRHRTEELPYVIGFIDGFTAGARTGFEEARAECIWERFEQLYRRHAQFLADLVAPLLSDLTPQQIDSLEARFAKQNEDVPDPDAAGTKRRLRKRGKRFISMTEWVVGSLDENQIALVKRVSETIPDTGQPWFEYRRDRQHELIRLLRQKPAREEIHAYLVGWWADLRYGGKALTEARDALGAGVKELVLAIGQSLSPGQREHLLRHLGNLRQEFAKMQGTPEAVALSCGQPTTAGPVRTPDAAPL